MGALFFIIGACFGSFFNVCRYRLPRKKSIASPPSYCPQCKHLIAWYDNIPILSYLLLKRKCRYCLKKIPLTYLIVELISAGVFLVTFLRFGMSMKLLVYLAFFSLLIVGSAIDAEREIIPDIITIPGIILGLATSFLTIGVFSSLIGGAVGAVVVAFFAILGKLLFKKEAMGGGDIKLLAMIGSFIGWADVLWVLFLASFIGLVFGLLLRKEKIRFGPFLSMTSFIIILVGTPSKFLL